MSIVDPARVNTAKNRVDFITSKTPLEKCDITNNFATNLVELSDKALNKLDPRSKSPDAEAYNMRFIKLSKRFYNMLMSVWLNFDAENVKQLKFSQFLGRVKDRVGEVRWNESLTGPVKNFYSIATEEYKSLEEDE